MLYGAARRQLGGERAKLYWRLTERALDHLEELAGDALRRSGSLRVAVDEAEREELEGDASALLAIGGATRMLAAEVDRKKLPIRKNHRPPTKFSVRNRTTPAAMIRFATI